MLEHSIDGADELGHWPSWRSEEAFSVAAPSIIWCILLILGALCQLARRSRSESVEPLELFVQGFSKSLLPQIRVYHRFFR